MREWNVCWHDDLTCSSQFDLIWLNGKCCLKCRKKEKTEDNEKKEDILNVCQRVERKKKKKMEKDFDIWQGNLYRWQNTIVRHIAKTHTHNTQKLSDKKMDVLEVSMCKTHVCRIIIFFSLFASLNPIWSDIINVTSFTRVLFYFYWFVPGKIIITQIICWGCHKKFNIFVWFQQKTSIFQT